MKKSLYKTIYEDIYLKLQDGTYNAGDLLPSEMELEKNYKVSRTPIRQALKELENNGYIYRLQGKGSFASNISPRERWTMATGFGSQYSREWNKISAQTLSVEYIHSKDYAEEFGLDSESNIIYLNRIRYFNKEPLVYMEHYIKPIIPLEIFEKDYKFVSAVGKLIKDEIQISFSSIKEEVEAVAANEKIGDYLNVEAGFPLLKIRRLSYHKNDLIDINIYYVRTDRWKYSINFDEN
ncbi:hypothetical protein CIL05_17175 [Virgibacillus profundi]|uniref:HTH gntR-type domain-containing protein n=1 Tax=Virgibacillus profundi TaxID=2024555 RepID=A0A2A2IB46_9BACI|nr:GntR family transcriptional regulator [Virgibacillus profundi]PAV28365.1 hypothetical protein CIL05_17175 [Virgibacillus profundi]PXY52273.1 GntR family transcriptional regulator [Virgibacillus profundi]